jgi:hypothetical protein
MILCIDLRYNTSTCIVQEEIGFNKYCHYFRFNSKECISYHMRETEIADYLYCTTPIKTSFLAKITVETFTTLLIAGIFL